MTSYIIFDAAPTIEDCIESMHDPAAQTYRWTSWSTNVRLAPDSPNTTLDTVPSRFRDAESPGNLQERPASLPPPVGDQEFVRESLFDDDEEEEMDEEDEEMDESVIEESWRQHQEEEEEATSGLNEDAKVKQAGTSPPPPPPSTKAPDLTPSRPKQQHSLPQQIPIQLLHTPNSPSPFSAGPPR